MGSATAENLNALTKVIYPKGIAFTKLRKSKLFMRARKMTKFGGKLREVKCTIGDGTGGSSTFSDALANRGPADHVTFEVRRKSDYVVGSLENEVIRATQGDDHAVLEALRSELDLKQNEMGERILRRFWGDEGGHLGIIESISTNTIVLTRKADLRHHKKGKVIALASDNGTGSSPTGGRIGSLTITKVDIATRTLTFSENVTAGIPAAIAGDYLFHPGDYGKSVSGVLAWTPITKPSTTFLGVDRSVAPQLLGGFRYSGSGGSMIETLNNAAAESFEYQTADDRMACLNGSDFARLMNELEGRVSVQRERSGRGAFAELSWKELVVHTPSGEIGVVAEPGVPQGYAIITDPEDWQVCSLGELPHFSDPKMQQESAADAQQYRLRAWWNVENRNPANTTIVSWGW